MKKDLKILISLAPNEEAIKRVYEVCPGAEVRLADHVTLLSQELPSKLLKGADVLLCEIPPANFDEFDNLKWIQLTSAGYTQVLKLPILDRGIRVTRGLGNFDIPIAEWSIMMMLMWRRKMLELLENQHTKTWNRDAKFSAELRGSTVGFWGYGGLSRETARIAKAMGMTIWALELGGKVNQRENTYCTPGTGDPEGLLPDRVFSEAQKKEFLEGLDFLILGLTLSPKTEGIIGEEELRMLKPTAVLINPARAPLINEQAYIKCLQEGWIQGSSCDVHYAYPLPPEHSLWSMPNLILTPHIAGGVTDKFMQRVYDLFLKNIECYSRDEALLNELTEDQLKGF